jgi:hypothetical protein
VIDLGLIIPITTLGSNIFTALLVNCEAVGIELAEGYFPLLIFTLATGHTELSVLNTTGLLDVAESDLILNQEYKDINYP